MFQLFQLKRAPAVWRAPRLPTKKRNSPSSRGNSCAAEVLAAVTAVLVQENTGLQMLSYIYTNNLLDLYPNLSIALRLMLTVPMTEAGERSFSRLKLYKTHLRSTVLQERLSALGQISVEHDVTRSLDRDDIIGAFSALKNRKGGFL